VARAAEVLHLAPRSVRDLIYAGRLPTLRVGRLHYVRASDLELERRRRLGLQLPPRTPRAHRATRATDRPRPERVHVDPVVRRERAAARAADVRRWAERHASSMPRVPFSVSVAEEATACAICGRTIRADARYVAPAEAGGPLCLTCGRRALLDWADRRRLEAAAARRLASELGTAREDQPPQVA
jgi:hypothetical protein